MYPTIAQALIEGLFTALVLGILAFIFKGPLLSYFNQKGKNLADKQDLDIITKIVESVKKEFAKETETLKAELQRLNNIQTSHRNEERNCIIDYYGKYNQWVYAYMEINFFSYNTNNIDELNEKRNSLQKHYAETSIAESKVRLLVKNDEIIKLSNQLLLNVLNFKGWMDKKLLELHFLLKEQKNLRDEIISKLNELANDKELSQQFVNDEKFLNHKLKIFNDEILNNRNIEFEKTIPADKIFREKVKEYLTK